MKPPELLVVDDDPADVALIREMFDACGSAVGFSTVDNGERALQFLRGEPPYAGAPRPNLIFLDLNIPRKDGRVVLREIKADPALRAIPVVVFTSSISPDDVARCYDAGASAFLVKPVGMDAVTRVMEAVRDFWFLSAVLPR